MLPKSFTKNIYISGAGYMMFSNVLVGCMNYMFSRYAALTLGPAGYGDITALFSWLALFTIPTGIMGTVIIQKLGAHPHNEHALARGIELWSMQLIRKKWGLLVLFIMGIPFVPYVTHLSPAAGYALIPLAILTCIAILYDGILQGLRKFVWFSGISVGVVGIKLSGVFAGMLTQVPLNTIVLFLLLSYVVRIFVSKRVFSRSVIGTAHVIHVRKSVTQVIINRQVILTAVSVSMIIVLQNISMVFVKQTMSAEDAGLFGAWLLVSNIILFVFGPLVSMGYIFFASKQTKKFQRRTLLFSLVLLFVVGTCYAGVYRFFGEMVVYLIFGSAFAHVQLYMIQAAVCGTGMMAVMLYTNYFLARGSNVMFIAAIIILCYAGILYMFAGTLDDVIYGTVVTMYSIVGMYTIAYAGRAEAMLQFRYAHPHFKSS